MNSLRSGRTLDGIMGLVSILVLLVCLFYVYAYLIMAPYPGFEWDVRRFVTSVAQVSPNGDIMRAGDQLVAIGDLTLEEFLRDRRLLAFKGFSAGDTIAITLVRDGARFVVDWQMVGPTRASVVNRLVSMMVAAPFWLAGTIIALLLRPRNKRWALLIALNYLVAVWLTAGSVSLFHVGYSSLVQRAIAWLLALVTFHLHLVAPESFIRRIPGFALPLLYCAAGVMAILELFQALPSDAYSIGLLLAFSGSLGLLTYRSIARTSPAGRLTARLMLAGFGLAFGPGIVLWAIPFLLGVPTFTNFSTIVTYLAISSFPLSYTYAIFKHHLGSLEFRANQLLASLSFILLNAMAFVIVFPLLNYWNISYEIITGFGFLWTMIIVGSAPYIRVRFERYIGHLAYGVTYDPDEIVHVFAERIPIATDFANLIQLLSSNILPSLLIRQTALYILSDTEAIPVYSFGLDPQQVSLPLEQIDRLLDEAEHYLPATRQTGATGDKEGWIRLALPLRVRGKMMGVWLFGRRDPDDYYPQGDIALLKTLSSQVAVAIENARLFQDLSGHLADLKALYDVSESIANAQDLDTILPVVAERTIDSIPQAAKAAIHLVEPNGDLQIACTGAERTGVQSQDLCLGLDRSVLERAVREQRTIHGSDGDGELTFADCPDDIRSFVVTPLIVGDEALGTLSIVSPQKNALNEASLNMLASLANQTAVAVKKAQINDNLLESFAALQERSAELEASLAHLQATQAQLIQSEKLASLGTLSAGIAHELNNPLAGIKIYTQNMLRARRKNLLTDELIANNLATIESLIDKMTHIIQHFRSFTRMSSGSFEFLDINKPLDDAMSMLAEQLRLREINVKRDLATDLPQVRGDAIQLEQVLVNLIGNARDAMSESAQKELSLRSYSMNGSVVVEVMDTGCGIPHDHVQKIFDPFFTTKEVGKGTGLGLSIVHSIITSHDGRIEVESMPGQGSVFRVVLPVIRR